MASSSCPSSPKMWVTPSAWSARVTRAPAKTEAMVMQLLASVLAARNGSPIWRAV